MVNNNGSELNKYGNQVWRDIAGVDIYVDWYERHQCRYQDGWERYPTIQDHGRFGIWINHAQLEILTFCEGDEIRVKCTAKHAFDNEIRSIKAWEKTLEAQAG